MLSRWGKKVSEKCSGCVYKCLPPPRKLKCFNEVCHPDIEEKYVYFLFGSDCDKIVEMYREDIIGRTYEEIDLHMLDFEIIKKDSSSNLKRAPKGRVNNRWKRNNWIYFILRINK